MSLSKPANPLHLIALRTLLRHRAQLVEHRAPHIQHMQKALTQTCAELVEA